MDYGDQSRAGSPVRPPSAPWNPAYGLARAAHSNFAALMPSSMLRTRTPYATLGAIALLSGAAATQKTAIAPPSAPHVDDLKIVAAKQVPMPGLTEISGGRTTIGSTEKEIEALLGDERYAGFVRILDAQTPQQTIEVEDFWIGTYEVTNCEYRVFVDATHHVPPIHWADEKATVAAGLEFAKAENDAFEAAKAAGRSYEKKKWAAGPPPTPLDKWWAENWRDIGYAIPAGEDRYPVIYVTYDDAVAYCEWAGLRLPTEFEFQRAARKDSKSIYPWGDKWDDKKYTNTAELRRAKSLAVGSFPDGVSPYGVHDLAGNVWEWTSSPYDPYKGFKPGKYRVKGSREDLTALPLWDPNQRVVVGGSFQEPNLAARINTRRGSDRTQFTNALGFRVAASTRVALDKADFILANVIRNTSARPDGVGFATTGVVGMDRWSVGDAGITGYDYVLFVPVEEIMETSDNEFRRKSLEKVTTLGFLSSNIDMLEPELAAGTYFVAFRAKGKPPRVEVKPTDEGAQDPTGDPKADETAPPEPVLDPVLEGLELDNDWLIFIRAEDGTRAAAIAPDGLTWEKGNGGGAFKIRQANVRIGSGASATIEPRTYLDLETGLVSKQRGRMLPMRIALRPSQAASGMPWRQ